MLMPTISPTRDSKHVQNISVPVPEYICTQSPIATGPVTITCKSVRQTTSQNDLQTITMRCCLLSQTLSLKFRHKYLPGNVPVPYPGAHLNSALPLSQFVGSPDHQKRAKNACERMITRVYTQVDLMEMVPLEMTENRTRQFSIANISRGCPKTYTRSACFFSSLQCFSCFIH